MSAPIRLVSTSWAVTEIRELQARLHLAANALGVPVDEISLADLCPSEAQRLRVLGEQSLWDSLAKSDTPPPKVQRVRPRLGRFEE